MTAVAIPEAIHMSGAMLPHAAQDDVVLRAEKVSKVFRGARVVDRVDLAVRRGERLAIIGQSGSGKSTVCRLFAGLEDPDEGTVFIGPNVLADARHARKSDRERRRIRSGLGFVPQQYTLFPHLTLAQNIALGPLRVRGMPKADVDKIVVAVLSRVGLREKIDAYPGQFSGGQRQRGAIARELAMQREILIFDEPTSALDPELSAEVCEVMSQLAADGLTMVVVTHEMDFARKFSDRVAIMESGRLTGICKPSDI
jgi:ABC-type polar amino acid transport system ATPase subunit